MASIVPVQNKSTESGDIALDQRIQHWEQVQRDLAAAMAANAVREVLQ